MAQFNLDRAGLVHGHDLGETIEVEVSLLVPTAEVGGADLPDEVAAVKMMLREAAFAGVVQAAGQLCASIECLDRRAAERAEAHARHVDH